MSTVRITTLRSHCRAQCTTWSRRGDLRRNRSRRPKSATRTRRAAHSFDSTAAWTWATLYVCVVVATWMATQTDVITPDRHILVETGNSMQHHSGTMCTNLSETQITLTKTVVIYTHADHLYTIYRLRSAGDAHLNPGPVSFPCRVCMKPGRRNQRAIMCDDCDFWHHAKCVDMTAAEYVRLSDSPEYWHCRLCTLPPFSDSFFNSTTDDSTPDNEIISDTSDGDDEVRLFPELRQLQDQSRKDFILGHLNINGVRNTFGPISELLRENLLQYLAITESKIDNSFPDSQFSVPNFTMYRRDRNQHGDGVLTYIRSDAPNRRLTDIDTNDLKIIINEITLQKVKWIVIAVYRPPNCDANVFLDKLQSIVDECLIFHLSWSPRLQTILSRLFMADMIV